MDQTISTGQKLMYTASSDVSVRRPDRFQVNLKGDLKNLRFWYDGKSITLLHRKENFYGVADSPSTIDDALEHVATRFGITAPLSDFALSDPYEAMMQNVQTGFYVGLHEVRGVRCHHLAFTQEDIDWQVWIEDGRMLVPRMLVITYKNVKGSPQYAAFLSEWDLSLRLPDSLLTFTPPEGAKQIEISPVDASIIPGKIK